MAAWDRGFTRVSTTSEQYTCKYQVHYGNRKRWLGTISGCTGNQETK
jgi:hypothetical protein